MSYLKCHQWQHRQDAMKWSNHMFTRIHSATIIVSDKDTAVDFYVNKLGWEKRLDQGMGDGSDYRFVTVAPIGSEAEIALELAEIAGRPAGGFTGISVIATDIDELVATLLKRGVGVIDMEGKPATEAMQMPWGDRAINILDPDGNNIFVNCPPA